MATREPRKDARPEIRQASGDSLLRNHFGRLDPLAPPVRCQLSEADIDAIAARVEARLADRLERRRIDREAAAPR